MSQLDRKKINIFFRSMESPELLEEVGRHKADYLNRLNHHLIEAIDKTKRTRLLRLENSF